MELLGGPTYLRDRGYTERDDHGRIEHSGFTARHPDGFDEQLRWLGPGREPVLAEHRRVRARPVDHGWELGFATTLTNLTGRALPLGSPATNDRAGAGYGGLFWRLPPAEDPHVRVGAALGEEAVQCSVGSWLVWSDRRAGFTLALVGTDAATRADPWFVRVGEYPGVGWQLAAREPLVLPPGGAVTRRFRALVADGVLDDRALERWAAGAPRRPPPVERWIGSETSRVGRDGVVTPSRPTVWSLVRPPVRGRRLPSRSRGSRPTPQR